MGELIDGAVQQAAQAGRQMGLCAVAGAVASAALWVRAALALGWFGMAA